MIPEQACRREIRGEPRGSIGPARRHLRHHGPRLTERHGRPEVLANPIGVDRALEVERIEPPRPGDVPISLHSLQTWRRDVHSHGVLVPAISDIAEDPIGTTDPEDA
jgi:hypothetical protein